MVNLQNKIALVTGAAGFIGANLTKTLVERGAVVHALVRPGGNWIRISEILHKLHLHPINLNDAENLSTAIHRITPDYIFNLASPAGHPSSPQARKQLLMTSVLGTANLLEAIAPIEFERFVHFGSSTEYGPRKEPLKESLRLEPITFRGVAKAAAALLCQQFASAYNRPVVIIRPFSVYGYWEAPTRLIPTAIIAALRDRVLKLTQPGFSRDPIFVDDLVEASLLALSARCVDGQIINVGSGRQWTNEQIVGLVQSLSGKQIRIQVGAYPASVSDTQHWEADISRAKKYLGWKPRYTLYDGLEKTIAWLDPHIDEYDSWKVKVLSG